jgi:nitrogen fixation NifU-like protein
VTPLGIDEELRKLLLEHYRHPRHQGHLQQPSHTARCFNPHCGDTLTVELDVENGVVMDVGFTGDVCSVAQTSSSLMSEHLVGASIMDARLLAQRFHQMMRDGKPDHGLGEMATLAKITTFPGRVDCALLAWRALEKALNKSQSEP